MTRSVRGPAHELPLDLVDAAGSFGAFAGALSLVLPYFVGLTVALSAVLFGAGSIRASQGPFAPRARSAERRSYALGFLSLGIGWGIFALPDSPIAWVNPLLLGISGLPLWRVARRALPFGGG